MDKPAPLDHRNEAADCMAQAEAMDFQNMAVPRLIRAAGVHATIALVDELRRIRPAE